MLETTEGQESMQDSGALQEETTTEEERVAAAAALVAAENEAAPSQTQVDELNAPEPLPEFVDQYEAQGELDPMEREASTGLDDITLDLARESVVTPEQEEIIAKLETAATEVDEPPAEA